MLNISYRGHMLEFRRDGELVGAIGAVGKASLNIGETDIRTPPPTQSSLR